MKNKINFYKWHLLSVVVLLLAAGCSISGALAGWTIKKNSTFNQPISLKEALMQPKGTYLKVYAGGKALEGAFQGTDKASPLTDSVANLLVLEGPKKGEVNLSYRIHFTEIDSVKAAVVLHPNQIVKNWDVVELPLESKIKLHLKDARVFEARLLSVQKENPPVDQSFNAIYVKNFSTQLEETVLVRQIDFLEFLGHGRKTYALEGFLAGLTIDGILIVGLTRKTETAVSSASTPTTVPQPVKDFFSNFSHGSCPYVYSFDGKKYSLEGELYAGAFFQGAQRTDICRLDHLKTAQGKYSIKIGNELDETQYIDQISLLRVDHPKGTMVYPSDDGELYLAGNILPPVAARDLEGTDVLDRIRKRDEKSWLANPFRRNPELASDLRGGVVLEFDRPARADDAVLVLGVQNTSMSINIQENLLATLGPEQDNWYERMRQSKDACQALKTAMLREIMLQVSVSDGIQWMSAGYVWEVGPAAERDVAVKLHLKDIPGIGKLKIKLDCVPGAWIVDYAGVDFQASRVVAAEIPVRAALDRTGADRAASLQATDGNYAVLLATGEALDLAFDAQAAGPATGFVRTNLIRCTGYFRSHVPADRDANLALMQKVVQEPGTYGRYVLKSVNEQVKGAVAAQERKLNR